MMSQFSHPMAKERADHLYRMSIEKPYKFFLSGFFFLLRVFREPICLDSNGDLFSLKKSVGIVRRQFV